jgi:hypothetical protein
VIVLTRDVLNRLMVWHLVAGALVGLLVLQPVNDLIYWFQNDPDAYTAWGYVWRKLSASIVGSEWRKGLFYAGVGALVGALTAAVSRRVLKQQRRMVHLTMELERDLVALIAKGESRRAEFKSSFRWDVKANKLNKALEHPVLKSLAAFLNADGGTLLIGVSDDGTILGVARDYQTLKKKDRDGFEQAIMTAVSTRMGTDVCPNLQVVFHAAAGDDVCRIIVNPSARPVYLSQGKETEFYVRTGTSTRQLNVQEAIEYIQSRWPK